ncbi:MAG: hypothetical protein QOJ12_1085, partial [Thermoleophilales bacterium]|nr:hypothetical protein [Thermoleophilales bacterium]
MNTHDHSPFTEDVGAYLLGALDRSERAAFERHLAGCAVCRRDVDELMVAVDALPRSVQQVAPPPALKASLMATVRAESRGAGAAPARRVRWGGRLLARPAFAAAAAAAVLALGVGAGAIIVGGDDQQVLRAQVDHRRAPGGAA